MEEDFGPPPILEWLTAIMHREPSRPRPRLVTHSALNDWLVNRVSELNPEEEAEVREVNGHRYVTIGGYTFVEGNAPVNENRNHYTLSEQQIRAYRMPLTRIIEQNIMRDLAEEAMEVPAELPRGKRLVQKTFDFMGEE